MPVCTICWTPRCKTARDVLLHCCIDVFLMGSPFVVDAFLVCCTVWQHTKNVHTKNTKNVHSTPLLHNRATMVCCTVARLWQLIMVGGESHGGGGGAVAVGGGGRRARREQNQSTQW